MAEGTAITHQPVVIDNGTGLIKAGFAGEERPSCVFPNYVGRPKHEAVMAGALEGDSFVGDKAEEHRGIMRIRYPVEHGVVQDWGDMEKVWSHIYSKDHLDAASENHPVLLTEAPLNPSRNREKAAEIMFEVFKVPALFFSPQAVLSLYASGRTTGLVLDVGDGVTHTVPVYQGFAVQNAIQRSDVGGRDVTRYMQRLLRKAGYPLHTSSEFEIVRAIKERMCYVRIDPTAPASVGTAAGADEFILPDGSQLKVDEERHRAPEVLFDPSLVGMEYPGVHQSVLSAAMATDMELRPELLRNVVVAGGSTLFSGFADRLLREVYSSRGQQLPVRVYAPKQRQFTTWTGGSILASLASFKSMWVRREDYLDNGDAIYRRSL